LEFELGLFNMLCMVSNIARFRYISTILYRVLTYWIRY